MSDAARSVVHLAPLVIAGFFIGGLVGWRAARFRRLYGRSPIHRPKRGDTSAHAFLSRMLVVYFGALVALALAAALVPATLVRVDPLFARRHPLIGCAAFKTDGSVRKSRMQIT